VRWPDFRLPTDRDDAAAALREAWCRAETERVEVAGDGGRFELLAGARPDEHDRLGSFFSVIDWFQ